MGFFKNLHSLYIQKTSKFFRQGMPFFVTILGSLYFVIEFRQYEYDAHKDKKKSISPAEAKKLGVAMTPEEIKEKEKKDEEKIQNFIKEHAEEDNDDWENVRGPRPEEDENVRTELDKDNRARILKAMSEKQAEDLQKARLLKLEDQREALRKMRGAMVGSEQK